MTDLRSWAKEPPGCWSSGSRKNVIPTMRYDIPTSTAQTPLNRLPSELGMADLLTRGR